MGIRAEEKNAFMAWVIRTMQANFDVVGTGDHVDAMSAPGVSMPAVEVG